MPDCSTICWLLSHDLFSLLRFLLNLRSIAGLCAARAEAENLVSLDLKSRAQTFPEPDWLDVLRRNINNGMAGAAH